MDESVIKYMGNDPCKKHEWLERSAYNLNLITNQLEIAKRSIVSAIDDIEKYGVSAQFNREVLRGLGLTNKEIKEIEKMTLDECQKLIDSDEFSVKEKP